MKRVNREMMVVVVVMMVVVLVNQNQNQKMFIRYIYNEASVII